MGPLTELIREEHKRMTDLEMELDELLENWFDARNEMLTALKAGQIIATRDAGKQVIQRRQEIINFARQNGASL